MDHPISKLTKVYIRKTKPSMCALSPLFPVSEWPLDAPISHESLDDLLHFNPMPPPIQLDRSLSFTGDSAVVKKLNHNASERDRRRKINSLCSSLRSLLPPSEQMTRLSIPATVSRVLTYIPELQAQVERLVRKKEEILSRIAKRQHDDQFIHRQSKSKDRLTCSTRSPTAVSATRIGEREIAVQISTIFQALETYTLSHILFNLEEDGLFLTEASTSCFESFAGRVFYNLHFQMEETCHLEGVVLNEKLSSLYREGR